MSKHMRELQDVDDNAEMVPTGDPGCLLCPAYSFHILIFESSFALFEAIDPSMSSEFSVAFVP